VLTAAAWFVTLAQTREMPMPMGITVRDPIGAAATDINDMTMGDMAGDDRPVMVALTFVAVWAVMMAAMMLPAAAPMLLIFAIGYLAVWTVVGLVVYVLVQLGSAFASGLPPVERARWAPIALGVTVILAGVYQFTPLKHVCLRHCRSPLWFVMQHWRQGRLGAFRMGLLHGTYCLGCCWALFAVLVAVGVMSVAWTLILTLVVFAEKVLPAGERASRVVGAAFILLGVAVASGVIGLPWVA
jgi:predicted metal-binding membrane protein